jgi:hypothetical protein
MAESTGAGGDRPPTPPDVDDLDRFRAAVAAIDDANAEDPTRLQYDGAEHPKELLHARLMTRWLTRLDPDAGEAAHLAARANHFRRWTRPRSDYPEGRAGYLRWRAAAKRQHATEVAELLDGLGYPADVIDRVGQIVRKEGLGSDPVVQAHEDALCLVFLDTQLGPVTDKVGEDEMVRILERTLPKLSAAGADAAMQLDLDTRGASLLARAVAGVAGENGK